MRVASIGFAVSLAFLTVAAAEARSQSLLLAGGIAAGCRGSDGSVCDRSVSTVNGTVAWQITEPFAVQFRLSRFDDAGAGEVSYFTGPGSPEAVRVRHEWGRTMNVGVEFLYRPPSLRIAIASAFVGGGAGIRTARVETTCVLGDCSAEYSALIQEDRWRTSYFSFVTGVDVRIAYGFVARGVLRVDDFPSETGTAQFGIELGYRLGAR